MFISRLAIDFSDIRIEQIYIKNILIYSVYDLSNIKQIKTRNLLPLHFSSRILNLCTTQVRSTLF